MGLGLFHKEKFVHCYKLLTMKPQTNEKIKKNKCHFIGISGGR
jgi:hypothetical protein